MSRATEKFKAAEAGKDYICPACETSIEDERAIKIDVGGLARLPGCPQIACDCGWYGDFDQMFVVKGAL